MNVNRNKPRSRRTFLRGLGVSLALPLLDAMQPSGLGSEVRTPASKPSRRRMVAICTNQGILPQNFFPVEGATLLDRTMVLYGTHMGSANAHSNTNLQVLLAGGGFKHGQHLAFDRKKNYPLANLFVSMLQQLGIEADRFASSTKTMRGLEAT
jgi:hypothetical protein